jgi:streptogramin lyase
MDIPFLSQRWVIVSFLVLLLLSGCDSSLSAQHPQKTPVATRSVRAIPAGRITEFPIPISNNYTRIGGITAGPDGNLWFTQLGVIWRMSPNGNLSKFPLVEPSDVSYNSSVSGGEIVVGPDGNLWFTQADQKIGRITPNGTITEFPLPTAAFLEPNSITAGPDGNLWFTRQISNMIGRISTSGVATEFPLPPSQTDPNDIISGPDGNLWFILDADQIAGPKIGRITPNGTVTVFSFPGTQSVDVDGLIVGPDGNFWFTDPNNNKIGRFSPTNPSGTVTEFPLPASDNGSPGHPGATPSGITAGPDGNLWFTEFYGRKIGRMSTSGKITQFLLPTPLVRPAGIVIGPDGNLWFTEDNAYKIGRITSGK